MDWHRTVEVFGTHQGKGARGSGYLLADRLILTAAHVIKDLYGLKVRLLLPDDAGLPSGVTDWKDAIVAWTGTGPFDLALLEPAEDNASFSGLHEQVRIARLGGRAAVRVDALGFPDVMEMPTHSDTMHIEATVNALTGVRAETLLVDVKTARSRVAGGWKGMSGAAVFAGDRLVGVMRSVPANLDESVLQATPAFVLFEAAGAQDLLARANIEVSEPPFVDAEYVAKLPVSGSWTALRADYARAVLKSFCRIDHVGMAVFGARDVKLAPLESYCERRLRWWDSGMADH